MTKKSLVKGTQEFTALPLSVLRPNPHNPRTTFSGPEFEKIKRSIQEEGVLQPLLVRPQKKGKSTHEIVFGGRRYAASCELAKKNGGLAKATIPVRIKALDDDAALDLMIVENLQREDLTPLEECSQFQAFVDRKGESAIPALAERTGLDAWYIRRRLLLQALPKKVLTLWKNGDLAFDYVEQLLRLRTKKTIITELAQEMVDWEEPISVLKVAIENLAVTLEKARFNIKDAGCGTCSANSANQKQLYGFESGPAQCMNPVCYKKKLTAHLKTNWKRSTWWRKHKTPGFIFYDHPAIERPAVFHRINGESTATDQCKECESHVTAFNLDGTLYYARACLGSYDCLKKQQRKGRAQVAAEEKKQAEKAAESAGQDPVRQPDPEPPAARSDWHGTWTRGEFYKKQLPLSFDTFDDAHKLNQLTLFNLIDGHGWELRNWYAVYTGQRTEKDNNSYWPAWKSGDLFDYIVTLDAKALAADLRAVTVQIALEEYTLRTQDRFARHIGVSVSKQYAVTEEYLEKKTKAELLHFGKTSKLFEDPKAHAYLEKTLSKKPGRFDTCKKDEMVDVFIKSGVDLVGHVPDEVFDRMPTIKAAKKKAPSEQASAAAPADTKDENRLPYWAVVQTGDDPCVWGVGKTKEDALDDALAHCMEYEGNDINSQADMEIELTTGNLAVAPCTEMLFDKVYQDGGEVEFFFKDLVGVMVPKEKVKFE